MIYGRHALEVFADHLAPEVVLEVDTYWAHVGGADVPALLRRLGEQVVALHIKDGDGTLDTKKQVPVGSGVIPIADIIAAAPGALRVVELDDSEGDLLDAVRASREFLISSDERCRMSRSGPVGVGVIGAGTISGTYLENLGSFPDTEVVAIGDLFPDAARRKAAEHGIASAGDVASVLEHDGVELVVNLTIPAAHAEVASQAIAAGKHVWNEKPLALDRPSGHALLDAARRPDSGSVVRRTRSWVRDCRPLAG